MGRVLFLLLLVHFNCYAIEKFSYFRYTIEDGLNTNTVYKITNDKKGNIYFGTDNGLTVFNGTQMKSYNTKDGMANPFVTSIFVDEKDRVFIGCHVSHIYKIVDGKIIQNTHYQNNETTSFYLSNKKKVFISRQINSKGVFWIYKILTNKKIHTYKHSLGKLPPFLSQGNTEIQIKNNWLSFDNKLIKVPSSLSQIVQVYFRKKDVCILTKQYLYFLDYSSKIKRKIDLPQSIETNQNKYQFVVDKNEKLWLNIQGAGLFRLSMGKWQNVSSYLDISPKDNINDLHCDARGRIWIATNEKGVFCIPNPNNIIFYSSENSNFTSVIKTNTNQILFTSRFCLYQYIPTKTKKIKTLPLFDARLQYADSANFLQNLDTQTEFKKIHTNLYMIPGLQVVPFSKNQYLVSQRNFFVLYTKNKNNFKEKILHFELDKEHLKKNKKLIRNKNQFFISNDDGIYRLTIKGNATIIKQKLTYVKENFIADFEFFKDQLFVASNDELSVYKKGRLIAKYRTLNNVKLKSIYKLKSQNGKLWVFTQNGIINYNGNKQLILNKYNFLPDHEATDIFETQDTMFITSKNGLAIIEKKTILSAFQTPILKLDSLISNSRKYSIKGKVKLPSENNSATFYLAIRNFYSIKNQFQEYQIDNGKWYSFNSNELNLPSIDYGIHSLKIRVKDLNSDWYQKTISLERQTPIYLKTWFLVVSVLLFLSLVIVFVIKRMKKIEEIKLTEISTNKKMVELRQSALSAMMNPHFIFNSLNAIQYYINSNQREKSSEYLAKFARLVRLFLVHASQPTILLSDEIKRLELYLQLEQERFKNFNYHFDIQLPKSAEDLEIPNMIVQPFVENAILHGLSHLKTSDGLLKIKIHQIESKMHITISDNGFGINNLNPKKVNHISKGIGIIQERLEILQKSNPEKTFSLSQKSIFPLETRKGHEVEIVISI